MQGKGALAPEGRGAGPPQNPGEVRTLSRTAPPRAGTKLPCRLSGTHRGVGSGAALPTGRNPPDCSGRGRGTLPEQPADWGCGPGHNTHHQGSRAGARPELRSTAPHSAEEARLRGAARTSSRMTSKLKWMGQEPGSPGAGGAPRGAQRPGPSPREHSALRRPSPPRRAPDTRGARDSVPKPRGPGTTRSRRRKQLTSAGPSWDAPGPLSPAARARVPGGASPRASMPRTAAWGVISL